MLTTFALQINSLNKYSNCLFLQPHLTLNLSHYWLHHSSHMLRRGGLFRLACQSRTLCESDREVWRDSSFPPARLVDARARLSFVRGTIFSLFINNLALMSSLRRREKPHTGLLTSMVLQVSSNWLMMPWILSLLPTIIAIPSVSSVWRWERAWAY